MGGGHGVHLMVGETHPSPDRPVPGRGSVRVHDPGLPGHLIRGSGHLGHVVRNPHRHRGGWVLHFAIGVRQTKQLHVICSITNLRSTLINSTLNRSSTASNQAYERHQSHRRTEG